MQDQNRICLEKLKQNLRGVKDEVIRRKALLMIRILESKRSIRVACAHVGVLPKTFYDWRKRFIGADYDISALANESRRPHRSPKKTPTEVEDELLKLRIENGNKSGKYISKLYEKTKGKCIPASTIDAIYSRRGVTQKRKGPKPNPHTRRYSMETPLERVQMDSVGLEIEDSNGNKVCAITAIDDCSRLAMVDVGHSKGSIEAQEALKKLFTEFGIPKLIQTDNGVEFTCKFNSLLNPLRIKEAKLSGFEWILKERGIEHYLIRPGTPQLNGKIERFHRTLKRELNLKALNGQPFEVIVKAIQDWVHWYNHERYHASLNYLTPQEIFTTRLKGAAA